MYFLHTAVNKSDNNHGRSMMQDMADFSCNRTSSIGHNYPNRQFAWNGKVCYLSVYVKGGIMDSVVPSTCTAFPWLGEIELRTIPLSWICVLRRRVLCSMFNTIDCRLSLVGLLYVSWLSILTDLIWRDVVACIQMVPQRRRGMESGV